MSKSLPRTGYQSYIVLTFLAFSTFSLLSLKPALATGSPLSFDKIMYNPAGTDNGWEWVELVNNGQTDITIIGGSGADSWRFFDSKNHLLQIEEPLAIPPTGHFILADEPANFYQLRPDYSWPVIKVSMSLPNKGGVLKLLDAEAVYLPNMGANGDGCYLQWQASHWQPSLATPNYLVSPSGGQLPTTNYYGDIIINEVLTNPASGQEEFIELYNRGLEPIDLTDWRLDDSPASSTVYTIDAIDGQTIIEPQNYLIFPKSRTGLALNDAGDEVRLLNPAGLVVYTTPSFGRQQDGWSFNLRQDDNWDSSTTPTSNQSNVVTKPLSTAVIVYTAASPSLPASPQITPITITTTTFTTTTVTTPPPSFSEELLKELQEIAIPPAQAAGLQNKKPAKKYILLLKTIVYTSLALLFWLFLSLLWPKSPIRRPKSKFPTAAPQKDSSRSP